MGLFLWEQSGVAGGFKDDISYGIVTAYALIFSSASDGVITKLVHLTAASRTARVRSCVDGKTKPVEQSKTETLRKYGKSACVGWN